MAAEMGLRRRVLAERFNTHTTNWLNALLARADAASTIDSMVLARIEYSDGRPVPEPETADEMEELSIGFEIRIIRCLGAGDFIITFANDDLATELFAKGHLRREVENLRLIAL